MIEVLSVLAAIIAAWFFGRSAGKGKARLEKQKELTDAIRTAREVERENSSLPDAAVIERMRRRANSG